ncbi:MAG: sulfatase-like hydrolase/transferase [Clostridia bacterium]|nr:sulfatase-like hydrolase/transferase [Clostridia bacterium]
MNSANNLRNNVNKSQPGREVRRSPAPRKRFPLWAFSAISFIYFEMLLYTLIGVSNSALTWIYLILTGGAVGIFLGAAVELVKKPKIRRGVGAAVFAVSPVLFCVEYFVFRSFRVCMTLGSILSGGGDVATGFTGVAIGLIIKGFWVIILYYVPLVLFCFFFRNLSGNRDSRVPLARMVSALVLELVCIGIISLNPIDGAKLSEQYNFDASVHTFGLSNSMILDMINTVGGGDDEFDFDPVDPETSEGTDTSDESGEGTDVIPTDPPVVYGKNEVDIDFAALAESEKNKDVAKLHSYIASQTPTSQNEYTGLFKGKNLILITAEAFSKEVIDPVRTPTLYRLYSKGINFTDYYQPAWGGSTSTGEYSVLMGLAPMAGVKSMGNTIGNNLYLTIGNQLLREGYTSLAYHNNSHTYYNRDKTHTNFGYSQFIGMGNGMEEGVTKRWPASDEEMMKYTFDLYASEEPFNIYYMTVSGHCLYNWTGNSMSKKNRDVFADMNASETIKAYHAANYELEKGLSYIVEQLEAKGIADDTVIVISTDHYPYGLEHSETWGTDRDYLSELYGYEASDIYKRDHSALIMWSGCLEDREDPIVVDDPVYSLDILPTLSNLFGLEYDSRLLVGRDVFSEAEPIVLWSNYSWITDKGSYDASTGTFTPKNGVNVDDGYVKRIKSIVGNKINFSRSAITLDYYDVLFGGN